MDQRGYIEVISAILYISLIAAAGSFNSAVLSEEKTKGQLINIPNGIYLHINWGHLGYIDLVVALTRQTRYKGPMLF